MVIGSFGSVSLDPPLVMFLPAKSSSSWPAIQKTGHFAVSVLGAHQGEVCQTVFDKGQDPFAMFEWHTLSTGSPVLQDCLAWIDCRIADVHEAGDHWIVVGEVVALGEGDPELGPLVFWGGAYGTIGDLPAPLT